eukprot:jgi/Bigna1/87544/estExt_fgenesh1_pg.C_210157
MRPSYTPQQVAALQGRPRTGEKRSRSHHSTTTSSNKRGKGEGFHLTTHCIVDESNGSRVHHLPLSVKVKRIDEFDGKKEEAVFFLKSTQSEVLSAGRTHWRVLLGRGVFSGVKCDLECDATEEDFDASSDDGLDGESRRKKNMPKLEKGSDDEAASDPQEKANRKKAHKTQRACNKCSQKICNVIFSRLTSKVSPSIDQCDMETGDGPGLHRALQDVHVAGTENGFASIFKFVNVKQEGPLAELEDCTFKFNQLCRLLEERSSIISPDIRNVTHLNGLSKDFDLIRDRIRDEGTLNESRIEDILRRVRGAAERNGERKKDKCVKSISKSNGPRMLLAPDGKDKFNRKLKCFNCKKHHPGGERSCTEPCRICKQPGHARCNCKLRNKQSPHTPTRGNDAHLAVSHSGKMPNWKVGISSGDEGLIAADEALFSNEIHTTCVDSGAAKHCVSSEFIESRASEVTDHVTEQGSVGTAGDQRLEIAGSANVAGLKGVKIVKGLKASLASVSEMCKEDNCCLACSADKVWKTSKDSLTLPDNAICIGTRSRGLCVCNFSTFEEDASDEAHLTDSAPANVLFKWHQILAHLAPTSLHRAVKNGTIDIPEIDRLSPAELEKAFKEFPECKTCGEAFGVKRNRRTAFQRVLDSGKTQGCQADQDLMWPWTPCSKEGHRGASSFGWIWGNVG